MDRTSPARDNSDNNRSAELTRKGASGRYLLALEPRMMFDGAAVATVAEVAVNAVAHADAAVDFTLPDPGHAAPALAYRSAFESDLFQHSQMAPGTRPVAMAGFLSRDGLAPLSAPDKSDPASRFLTFPGESMDRVRIDPATGDLIEGQTALDTTNPSSASSTQDLAPERIAVDTLDGGAAIAGTGNTFIFIDSSVEGYEALAEAWADQGKVVIIDSTQDGMDQILAALAGQTEIEAIHFVSHGASNTFVMGTTWFMTDTVTGELAQSLALIGSKMSADGDILIYGCDVSDSAQGQQFIDAFAAVTSADVAASDDGTGHIILGGDWDLEVRTGTIEATTLISTEYAGLLQLTNSGGWLDLGNQTYRAVIDGVTVTMQFVDGGGDFNTFVTAAPFRFNTTRETVNNAATGLGFIWNNSATAGQVIVTFSEAIANPILNVGALGGVSGGNTNSSVWTVASGQTLTEVRGEDQFDTTTNSFQRRIVTQGSLPATDQFHRSGAVQVNGTVTSVTFNVTRAGAQGVGDGVELGWSLDDSPPSVALTQDNLITNGSFENGNSPWTSNGPLEITNNEAGYGIPQTTDGDFFIEVEGGTGASYIQQTITTVAGRDYVIELDAVTRNNANIGDRFEILVNGVSIGTFTTGAQWNAFGATFTADSANSTIRIQSLGSLSGISAGAADTAGLIVDNVQVYQQDRYNTYVPGSGLLEFIEAGSVLNGDATDVLSGTTITLTNPQAGDRLLVNGSTATSGTVNGIAYTNTGTQIIFTGSATEDAYKAALNTVRYENTLAAPSTVQRVVSVTSRDSTDGRAINSSNTAFSYIDVKVGNVPPQVDLNGDDPNSFVNGVGWTHNTANSPAAEITGPTVIASGGNETPGPGLTYNLNNSVAVIGGVTSETYSEARAEGEYLQYTFTTAAGISPGALLTAFYSADWGNFPGGAPAPGFQIAIEVSSDGFATSNILVRDYQASVAGGGAYEGRFNDIPDGYQLNPNTTYTVRVYFYAVSSGTSLVWDDFQVFVDNETLNYTTAFTEDGAPVSIADVDAFTTDFDNANLQSASITLTNAQAGDQLLVNGSAAATGTLAGGITYTISGNTVSLSGNATQADYTAAIQAIQFNNTSQNPSDVDRVINVTVNDGLATSRTATTIIDVIPVNDAPVAIAPAADTAVDAEIYSYNAAALFTDVDGGAPTYSATGLPAGLTINPTTGVISGTLDNSASQVNGGVYNIVITANDGRGGTTSTTLPLTVTNPAPTATNDSATTAEDTAATIPVLANDTDPDGDALTVTAASAGNGTVTINADGSLTYTPNANFFGSDTITYTISDGEGGTSTALVAVAVTSVNDVPVATPVGAQTAIDGQVVNISVATQFSDADGDALTYSATGLPAGLTIDPATGVISGTIDNSASQVNGGSYSVVITASDGNGGTATLTIPVTVTNPTPTANNDTASTNEDTPVTIPVLANDTDPDGDTLTVVAASAGNGTVTINADGSVTYTPNANFNGTDTITYTISDGEGGTSTATVTVTVAPVNDTPTSVGSLPAQSSLDATTIAPIDTSGAFADPEGDTLTYTVAGLPAGLTIDANTGIISGTLDNSASQGGALGDGVYTVTVTATDPGGLTATQTFTYTVDNPVPVAVNDTATTAEDTPVTVNVLANDSDPDLDALTLVSVVASVGQATVVGNQLIYTPPANFNGTATVTYTISDGEGGTATATATITVTPVNDNPVADPIPTQNVSDAAPVALATGGFFSDVDGDDLTFSAAGLPAGLTIDPATGLITGTIDNSASQVNGGVYTVTITADDGNGGTVTQTVTFNVANPAPTANNDSASTTEDTPVVIPVLANDTDPDGDTLTVTDASAANGTVVINADGTITYAPNANFFGTDTITYQISDGEGGFSTAVVTVTVGEVNDPPVATGVIADQANGDSDVISLPVGAAFFDADGDTLTYTAIGLPAGLTIDPATGVISGTIDNSASQVNGGAYTVTVTATDGRGGTDSLTFDWQVDNIAPLAANDTITIAEDTPTNIAVLANDVDPDGDDLTVTSAFAGHGTVTINADGTIDYVPDANFNGTDTIVYTISDGEGGSSTATVDITITPVNDAPTTTGIPNQNGDDGEAVTIPTAGSFTDVDGDDLTFTAVGLPPALTIDPDTGVISGVLGSDTSVNGPYTVTVTATDPSGESVSTTFIYTVQNVPPVAVNDTATTAEDTPVTVAVLTNDSDPDNDPLTITSASATGGTVVINADGTLTFTPAANFNGEALVTYTISDGQGGIATATLTVDVTPVNDAPVSEPIGNIVNEDAQAVSVDTGDFFSDIDGDTLTFTATGLPAGLTIDPATGLITGTIDNQASQGGPAGDGQYSVTITADDGNGGTVSQTIIWAVTNPAPTAVNDTATTAEDTAIDIDVLANDTDPDGDTLVVTSATAANGTVTINPDGTINYVPDANFSGTDTIVYEMSDGNGGVSTASVTVTVTAVNDAPVARDDTATTNEDTPVTIGVLANDTDVDGDPLTVTAATSPDGTVTINADGTIVFTPNANFNGTTSITYTISDGNGGTATATVAVTVVPVNDPPVANPDAATTAEDTPVTIAPLVNDTDVDGDPLTVTSAIAANGTVTINADGTVIYTPDADFNGTDTITYTISDGNGGTSTSTITIDVTPVNDAPVTTGIAAQTSVDAAVVSLDVSGSFSDVDGDTLTYAATGLPAGLTIDPATGIISGTIDNSASQLAGGVYSVTVTAVDGNGGTVSTTFTYTVTNPAPTANNDTATTNEDTPVVVPVLGNDTDPDGDALTVISATAPNGSVVINADGTITYTPNPNFNGTDTITYQISDGEGGTSTAIVTVTVDPVNDAPVVDSAPPAIANLDGEAVSYDLSGTFADVDGDTLTYSATGLPAGVTIDPVTGIISGTIDNSASQVGTGLYTVVLTASDANGGTVSTTFVWSVTNPAPTANDDTASTNEDTPVVVDVLLNDNDPDGDALTVISASASNGTVVINADGTITYTPDANYFGTDSITYTISDGEGGTSTATVTVTIASVNDAPVVDTAIPSQTTTDSATVSYDVSGNFSDVDGDTLSYAATNLPAGLTIDPATGVISGTIAADASQTNGGVYPVTVTVSDGNGGTVTTTFNITVTNPPPVAANDTATVLEDGAVVIPVLDNDSDPDGDALTVISASAANGTVTINADGTITYTPNADFNGSDTITYQISDGEGGFDTATVAVTVTPVNDAPVAAPLTNQSDSDADVVSVPVASAFTDIDGDTLSYTATGLPAGLTIDPVTGVISGTIASDASVTNGGVYSVTVTASDGNGGTASTTFTWTVDNPAPTANNDVATTAEDTPVLIDVLLNDTDPDNDALTVTSATAANGSVVFNPDGSITYIPNADFNGTDTITYTISDGQGGTDTATVTVTVTPVNDAPVAATIPDRFANDSQTVSADVSPYFSDVDGDTLTFSAVGLPTGLTIDPVTGIISGTIDPAASATNGGVYTVTVTVSDGNGGVVSTDFTWTVANIGPVATDDAASTNEDTPVNIDVLNNDTDPDLDPLSVVSATSAEGTVVIEADGTLTFTPNANFNGTATIDYTITDNNGGFASGTVTVTVFPVNDAPVAGTVPAQADNDSNVVSLDTSGVFSDIDGDTLTYSAIGLPPGLTIDPVTGVISGTIDADASQTNGGVYTVTVTADDGNGGTVPTTFTWTVANPAPIATNDLATTPEDTPVVISVLANDNDPDGDPLTVTAASATSGTVVINADGSITYTPAGNFNGTDTITYTISDGNGGFDTATVTVTVTSVNDAPVAGTIADQVSSDSDAVSIPTAAVFSDVDGDTLSYSAAGLPAGLTIDPATGIISGTIAADASQTGGGVYTVTVTADDGNGGTVSTTFTYTVTNPAPVAANDSASTTEDTPVVIDVLGNDNDPDGDLLTVVSASAPNGTVTINADGSLTYTPNADFNGSDTVTYTISDGQGGFSTAFVDVTVASVNDAPVVDAPLVSRTNADADAVSFSVAGNFSDVDGDTLSYSATGLPAGITIDPVTGIVGGTIDPAASQVGGGIYTVTVTASDGNGGTVTSTFTWTVTNPAPVAANDTLTTAEDTPATVAVLANDNDPDGDALTVVSATAANGTVTINADGTLSYTPDANFNGTDTITYTISDGNGGFDSATVAVTVTPVNDAPVANPETFSASEDTPLTLNVLGNDTDVDGDPLTVTAATSPNGTVTINPDGTLTFVPAPDFNGTTTVTYTISDGNGGTSTVTSTIVVAPVNDPPVATNDTATTNEDTPVNIAVLANDSDVDGDPLTVTAATSPDGTVTINPDGTITFVPNPNFNGTATITYTISDGNGGTDTATVAVTVNPVNDVPVAANDTATTAEDTPVTIPVLANDTDADGNPLTVVGATSPNGTVTINPDGTITFVPNPDFNGPATITYTISDGNGGFATATVAVTVTPVNDPPVALDDSASMQEDGTLTVPVLANDSDADGDALTVTGATSPDGTVTVNPDGTITFVPNPDFNGTATVTYTITDGNGGTDTAILTIAVAPVNDAPVTQPDTATTPEDTPVTIDVLANDGDVDGDPLTVVEATSPDGTVTINPDGTITFTPAPDFNGPTTITYTVSDGNGGFVTQTVTVNVGPVNDAPEVVQPLPAASGDDADVITIPTASSFTDVDGDPLTFSAAGLPAGLTIDPATGVISGTLDSGASIGGPNGDGTYTITVTASDGNGGTVSTSFTFTATNPPPVAVNDAARVNEDGQVTIPVLANDSDPDGDALTVISASAPNGTVTINPDGTITYTPNPDFNGTDTITYTISDGNGGTATATAVVAVTPINDPPVANADAFTGTEDTPLVLDVLANDTDVDRDPLTVTAASSPDGTITINPDGTLTFVPNPNFTGTTTVTYTISDGNGGTSTVTSTITIAAVNDPPVATDDVATTDEDTPVTVDVLGNDSDADGDPLTVVSASSPDGTVTINPDGTITFVPNANFNGTTTVTYTISDGNGGTSTATVTIGVTPV
ncbi:Ig-like domain-containing protein, partial [Altererythrobacter sp. CAU 1778]